MEPVKVNIINILQLLASVQQQDNYNRDVPIANVSVELVNQWFDDFFDVTDGSDWLVEYFNGGEISILMEFHKYYDARVDNLPGNYEELREDFNWKQIVGKAQWALAMLGWTDIEAKYDE
jgi:hypothetical protein